jgi:signal transduction histidine kinase
VIAAVLEAQVLTDAVERIAMAPSGEALAELAWAALARLVPGAAVVWVGEGNAIGDARVDPRWHEALRRASPPVPAELCPPGFAPETICVAPVLGGNLCVLTAQPEPRAALAVRVLASSVRCRQEALQLKRQLVVAERMATLGTMVTGIGHEITNPLATAMLNSGALLTKLTRGDLPAGVLTDAQRILAENDEALDRIRALVNDLRVFGRRDDDHTAPLDLRAVIESALRMSRASLRSVELELKLPPLPLVHGSVTRLGQVFLNLLVNAAHAVGAVKKPRVVVVGEVIPGGDGIEREVRVGVVDNGHGIADEDRPHLFEMFFTTKAAGEGTGLGLPIARDIIVSHGGRIELGRGEGQGAAFWVTLPVASSNQTSRKSSPGIRPARRRPSDAHTPEPEFRPRVLIIDDEVLILRALARELAREFDITVACSGSEAEAALKSGGFDAVLCDLNLGGESGIDVVARLEARTAGLRARTVFMSGGPLDGRQRDGLAGGADGPAGFVAKPFAFPTLLQLLRQVTQPPAA